MPHASRNAAQSVPVPVARTGGRNTQPEVLTCLFTRHAALVFCARARARPGIALTQYPPPDTHRSEAIPSSLARPGNPRDRTCGSDLDQKEKTWPSAASSSIICEGAIFVRRQVERDREFAPRRSRVSMCRSTFTLPLLFLGDAFSRPFVSHASLASGSASRRWNPVDSAPAIRMRTKSQG